MKTESDRDDLEKKCASVFPLVKEGSIVQRETQVIVKDMQVPQSKRINDVSQSSHDESEVQQRYLMNLEMFDPAMEHPASGMPGSLQSNSVQDRK